MSYNPSNEEPKAIHSTIQLQNPTSLCDHQDVGEKLSRFTLSERKREETSVTVVVATPVKTDLRSHGGGDERLGMGEMAMVVIVC